jgi:hypothetical protein
MNININMKRADFVVKTCGRVGYILLLKGKEENPKV